MLLSTLVNNSFIIQIDCFFRRNSSYIIFPAKVKFSVLLSLSVCHFWKLRERTSCIMFRRDSKLAIPLANAGSPSFLVNNLSASNVDSLVPNLLLCSAIC